MCDKKHGFKGKSFALIVVLFILLIIVGASFTGGKKKYSSGSYDGCCFW